MKRSLLLVLLLGIAMLAPGARAEEEDDLAPTPARSPADVARTMEEHGIPEVELEDVERKPEERSVVGALTGQAGGRVGFMPLLQHHMGVEHWFVEGLTKEKLGRWPAKGQRLFVRLEGTVALERLWSPFGGGTGFYGDGLPHGQVYGSASGGVMGYHESVYRLVVDTVTWVRTKAEFQQLGREYAGRQQATKTAIERGDWAAALAAHRKARELHVDLGVHRGDDLEPGLRALLLLEGDAAGWSEEDLETIALPFEKGFGGSLGDKASAVLRRRAPTWDDAARERLGARLVEVWKGLGYRFQKEAFRKDVLSVIGGDAIADLERRIAEAEAKLAELGSRLRAHVEAHAYARAKAVWDEMAPHQAFLLTYEFGEQRTQHWLPSLERLLALETVWDDLEARLATLEAQIREAVAAGDDLPNNAYRPRYPRALAEYFLPKLEEPEQRRIEALLIELAEPLHPTEDWDGSIVALELLSGVAGEAAVAFLPDFLAKRTSVRAWQRKYIDAFAETIRGKAR